MIIMIRYFLSSVIFMMTAAFSLSAFVFDENKSVDGAITSSHNSADSDVRIHIQDINNKKLLQNKEISLISSDSLEAFQFIVQEECYKYSDLPFGDYIIAHEKDELYFPLVKDEYIQNVNLDCRIKATNAQCIFQLGYIKLTPVMLSRTNLNAQNLTFYLKTDNLDMKYRNNVPDHFLYFTTDDMAQNDIIYMIPGNYECKIAGRLHPTTEITIPVQDEVYTACFQFEKSGKIKGAIDSELYNHYSAYLYRLIQTDDKKDADLAIAATQVNNREFTFENAHAGDYYIILRTSHSNDQFQSEPLKVNENQTTEVFINTGLTQIHRFQCQALDGAGKPIRHTPFLFCHKKYSSKARTDQKGNLDFPYAANLSTEGVLKILAEDGFLKSKNEIKVDLTNDQRGNFVFSEITHYGIKVVNSQGRPITKYSVSLKAADQGDNLLYNELNAASKDGLGVVNLEAVPRGEYNVYYMDLNQDIRKLRYIDTIDIEEYEEKTIEAGDLSSIELTFKDVRGNPVAGVYIIENLNLPKNDHFSSTFNDLRKMISRLDSFESGADARGRLIYHCMDLSKEQTIYYYHHDYGLGWIENNKNVEKIDITLNDSVNLVREIKNEYHSDPNRSFYEYLLLSADSSDHSSPFVYSLNLDDVKIITIQPGLWKIALVNAPINMNPCSLLFNSHVENMNYTAIPGGRIELIPQYLDIEKEDEQR